MAENTRVLAIGLMSGTSLDGVDAALVETDGGDFFAYKKSFYVAYDKNFRHELKQAAIEDIPLNQLLRLEKKLTEYHAEAVHGLLHEAAISAGEISVLGFHGQTVRHLPEEGITCQIGNASLLAELTGIPVVADFRRRDMAAGGQGAPLVPLFHQTLFSKQDKPLAVLNIGGVANVTCLCADGQIISGDTGPGMGLLDAWIQQKTDDSYDVDGKYASQGQVDENVVNAAMVLPFMKSPLPKSADRYDFDDVTVDHLSVEDGAATLCQITAEAVIRTLSALENKPTRLWLTGGGAHHPVLLEKLAAAFDYVGKVTEVGLREDSIEAECFAWLAVRRLYGLPLTTTDTTGCRHENCGGVLTV